MITQFSDEDIKNILERIKDLEITVEKLGSEIDRIIGIGEKSG